MRRLATVLTTLTAAAALAVAIPQSASPAFAATGELILNGTVHVDPSGCYRSDRRPLFVDNRTDSYVFVYERADCAGRTIGIVRPDQRSSWPLGRAVAAQ
ncbi:hypothetical protein [Streptomyces qinzhouensis]|uniref:Secreted protein n=1 Tax=Streptomyces qinzhouensis TaxID=2599401 RepID=A0A5B8J5K0_9ACTN|nr:hypothetical protein [Streptomyces qinzhouensis]QDY76526.1 hypothetical protein FQU76_08250 [Streptomyces qinzhouensis]